MTQLKHAVKTRKQLRAELLDYKIKSGKKALTKPIKEKKTKLVEVEIE